MNRLPQRLLGVVFALQSSIAWPQNTVPDQPSSLQGAVITPSDPASTDVWLIPETGGGLRAQNVIVWQLIKNAYYIRDEQLEGGPAWVRSDRYDIVARPGRIDSASWRTASPAQAGSYLERSRLRMQALLKERFALTLRTEERAKQFYALKLSEKGLKVRPAGNEGGPVARMRNGQLSVTADAKGIAALLTDVIGTTVVDETGLAGYYTVNLEWDPDAAGDESILRAVSDQIGLELERKTGPLAVFVIERIERPGRN